MEDVNGEEVVGTFNQKNFQKAIQTEFRIEKVPKKKGDKLLVC